MRKLLFVVLFSLLASPAYGQQLASVMVTAHVRIPDFMNLRVGETTTVSATSRRVTVYVNANRLWQLSAEQRCTKDCAPLRWRVVSGDANPGLEAARVVGGNGNDIPVVLEYEWNEGAPPPDPADLHYMLTTG